MNKREDPETQDQKPKNKSLPATMARVGLILSDFITSFMWVWSSVLVKMFVHRVLGFGHDAVGDIVRYAVSVINMFFFAFLGRITKGGAYNPLNVLGSAVSGGFDEFFFCVGVRIPAQVLGSIAGVRYIIRTFPGIGLGPRLNVMIHHGAMTEGLLTFAIVTISLNLSRKIPGSFFMKTWITSLSKLTLHILGSDLTGGCMNPAAVMGWAYARGDHISKEHITVYWLAPIKATLLAIWMFKFVFKPLAEEQGDQKAKSE